MHSRCKGVEDDNGLRGLQTFRTCASGSRRVRWWCVLFYFIYFILAQTADSSQHHRAEANPSPSTSHLLLPGSPFDISTNHKCKTSVPSLTIHSPSATRRCRILHPMTPPRRGPCAVIVVYYRASGRIVCRLQRRTGSTIPPRRW